MKRKRCTDKQIAYALRQAEPGTPVREIWRKMGASQQTFYTRHRGSAGIGVAKLHEEHRKLEGLVKT